MPISLPDVETALVKWVELASGLPTAKVLLAQQKAPQATMPYATVRIGGGRNAAGPWGREIQSYDPAQPLGQEIGFWYGVDQEVTVSVQFFTEKPYGPGSARTLDGRLRASIMLPSVLDALRKAGLALVDAGDMSDLSALMNVIWQGRTNRDFFFRFVEDVTERTGYVERFDVTGTVS